MDPVLIAVCGMLIGLTLLVVEFFIPSGGLIFILACISLVVGTWGAWKAWGGQESWMFATYLGLMFVLAPGSIVGGLYLLNNTSLGDRVLLKPPAPEDVEGFQKQNDQLRELIGQRGTTHGLMAPGGMVHIEGTRYHCESLGMIIQPSSEVEVIDVRGNRLVVRVPLEDDSSQDTDVPAQNLAATDEPDEEGFDFDVPEDS